MLETVNAFRDVSSLRRISFLHLSGCLPCSKALFPGHSKNACTLGAVFFVTTLLVALLASILLFFFEFSALAIILPKVVYRTGGLHIICELKYWVHGCKARTHGQTQVHTSKGASIF